MTEALNYCTYNSLKHHPSDSEVIIGCHSNLHYLSHAYMKAMRAHLQLTQCHTFCNRVHVPRTALYKPLYLCGLDNYMHYDFVKHVPHPLPHFKVTNNTFSTKLLCQSPSPTPPNGHSTLQGAMVTYVCWKSECLDST